MTDSGKSKELLVNRLLEYLRREIIEGRLKPREKILEENLSKKFKISRSPIREAFRILESEGLIDIIPRKGFYVTDINEKDIDALYTIRPVLESVAVRLACRNITGKNLEYLSKIVNQMENVVKQKDFNLYFQLNRQFHETIISIANNKFLAQILKTMGNQALRYRFFAISFSNRINQSLKNHKELLEALCSRDENKAEMLRYKHVEDGGRVLKRALSLNTSRKML